MKNFEITIPVEGKIMDYYGLPAQRLVWCEELAELTQAISKDARKGTGETKRALLEECADVLCCIGQILESIGDTVFTLADAVSYVEATARFKTVRQIARMQADGGARETADGLSSSKAEATP